MITVVVRPARNGRFVATMKGRDLCNSRTPLLTAARVLKREGAGESTELLMVHHEAQHEVALRTTVGWAAKHTVTENANSGPWFATYTEPKF